MLLQQVLDELSTHPHINRDEEENLNTQCQPINDSNPHQPQDIKHSINNNHLINASKHLPHISNHDLIKDSKYINEVHSHKVAQKHPPHYHKDHVIKDTNHVIIDSNHTQDPPLHTIDVKRSASPLTRHTGSSNAHYLYRAAIAAKQIQSSNGHSRLSAPALLANCLLSMISLSDEDDLTDKIEDDPTPAPRDHGVDRAQGRNTILKSFSQLHAEERNGKEALINQNNSLYSNHKKLEIVSCCLFPCKRNISSKTLGSTLELLHNSDELSSTNDGSDSRSRAQVSRRGGACAPGNLRSFMKRVLCKGSSEAGTRSSIGDNIDMIFDDDHQGLNVWAGTPLSNQSLAHQDETDHSLDKYHINNYDHNEYMYNNSDSLLHVDKIAGDYNYGAVKAERGGIALEMRDGAAAQEVVHDEISLSHDAPIASSFVFEQSCFSSSSSTSSTCHCMKLESSHPWLVSTGDLDSCSTSPLHNMHNRVPNANNEPSASNGGTMQDEIQKRFANKRLNLSR